MDTLIRVTIGSAAGPTITLTRVQKVRLSNGRIDYALTADQATQLLDRWAESAPFRGYTTPQEPDDAWPWILAEPTGPGDPRLLFSEWCAADDETSLAEGFELAENRWLVSGLPVATDVTEYAPIALSDRLMP